MSDLLQKDTEREHSLNPHLELVLDESTKAVERTYINYWFTHPDKKGTFSKKEIILGQYPQLQKLDQLNEPERSQLIHDTVEQLYSSLGDRLVSDRGLAEQRWRGVEGKFFENTREVFGDAQWPEGEYKCFMSVVNINSLLKDQKSFQLFYEMIENGFSNAVIGHEMLHFIFYKYMEQFPEYNKETQWQMAEIFNALVQNSQRFKDFNYPEEKKLDPDMEEKLATLRGTLDPETLTIENYLKAYQDFI